MARGAAIWGVLTLLLLVVGATPSYAQSSLDIPAPTRFADPATGGALPSRSAAGDDAGRREAMDAIWNASQRTGVDYRFLLAKASLESGLNPRATAKSSSAAGLFQFIESTWLSSLERYEGDVALARTHLDPLSRAQLLNQRLDPRIASLVAAHHALENAKRLNQVLGREASNTELYLAHFLGTGGAVRFVSAWKRNPELTAARLFPGAARANPSVFYSRNGRARSLNEILRHFDAKMQAALGDLGEAPVGLQIGQKLYDYELLDGYGSYTFDQSLPLDPGATNSASKAHCVPSDGEVQMIKSGKSLKQRSQYQMAASLQTSAQPSQHANSPTLDCNHIVMCYFDEMSTSTITQIRELVDSGAYTKAGIARAAGLHANTLRDASEPDWNPTAETLSKLQKFLDANDDTPVLVGIEEIIDEARNGRMYILVDDEDRENEGDLIIPAQMATPSAINFMATHGRGLICLALDKARVDQLGLDPMSRNNKESMQTAFTVSIEAKEGVTTGISAADRARTVSVAIDASKGADDIVTPGHVFPLMARDGGTLVRAGHTEAAVDISRLAGLNPSGVICEIMNEDGTMARLDDLVEFARKHSLKIGTIRDLIAYRMRHDHLVERIDERSFESDYGGQWRLITYRNTVSDDEAYVLQKGHVVPEEPTLARVHPISLFDDILGAPGPRQGTLQRAMSAIGDHGSGVIVILTQRVGTSGKWSKDEETRTIGIGSQILSDLGIEDMILLTNSRPDYVGLEGYGLSITDHRPIPE